MDLDEKTRAEWLEFYRASAKQTIGLRRVYPPDGRAGGSAFGGLPHLPSGVPWPLNQAGKPLPFALELDLAALPQIPDLSLLPPEGALYLFMEHDLDEGELEAKILWQPVELAKVPERQPPPGWIHWIEVAEEIEIDDEDAEAYSPALAYKPREPIDPFVMTTYTGWPPELVNWGSEKIFAFWELTKGGDGNGWDITKSEWAAAQVPLQKGARLSDADRAAWPFDWLCVQDMAQQIRFSEKGKKRWIEAGCEEWERRARAEGMATAVSEAGRKRFWNWLRKMEWRPNRLADESIRRFHRRYVAALSAGGQEVFRSEHQQEWRLLGHGTRLPNFDTARHLSEGKVLLFACNPRASGGFPPPIEIWIDRNDLAARRFDKLVADAHFT